MIASIRCSSVGLDGLLLSAIFPAQMGTCCCVPEDKSRSSFGRSGLSATACYGVRTSSPAHLPRLDVIDRARARVTELERTTAEPRKRA